MPKTLGSIPTTRKKKVSTIKLVLLEDFQKESPFGYSEGKKKYYLCGLESGDILCRCLQQKLARGKSACP
jgi:hypothetical protein